MSTPTIEFDGVTYTVTLFRDGKKEYVVFGEHTLSVCSCHENELASWERSQIKTAPNADGFLYYIHARPRDVGRECFVGLENKEEALAIRRVLLFLEENEDAAHGYYRDEECSFCGKRVDDCGEDHGDEMRDWQREALDSD